MKTEYLSGLTDYEQIMLKFKTAPFFPPSLKQNHCLQSSNTRSSRRSKITAFKHKWKKKIEKRGWREQPMWKRKYKRRRRGGEKKLKAARSSKHQALKTKVWNLEMRNKMKEWSGHMLHERMVTCNIKFMNSLRSKKNGHL